MAHETALEDFGGLPGFKDGDRGQGAVESALATPFFTMAGVSNYPSHFHKVAAIGYFIARNHGFNDANKRTALSVVTQTLAWNGEYLEWSEETETLIFRLLGFGELPIRGLKYALLDACGHDVRDAKVFEDT